MRSYASCSSCWIEKAPALPACGDWDDLLSRAAADHRALMERSSIDLGADDEPGLDDLTIGQRLARVREGKADGGLLNLYLVNIIIQRLI